MRRVAKTTKRPAANPAVLESSLCSQASPLLYRRPCDGREGDETMAESKFAAADATLGYLYQVRCALLWTLKRLRSQTAFLVSVETLDDVTFERVGGEPTDLLQTKHHRRGVASLADASVDLWKTLRIWFEGRHGGAIPATTTLFLVTTAACAKDSAASCLRHNDRNVELAKDRLDAVARSSAAAKNAAGYKAFLAATPATQLGILEQVFIVDNAPSITDLEAELREEIFWVASRENHTAFLERLEGWWLRRVVMQLTDPTSTNRIGSVELDAEMTDLRDQFRQGNLPIDEDLQLFDLDDATAAAHQKDTFVLHLYIIKAGKQRIAAAIRDYYRAFEQRSRWMRDRLVLHTELGKYEKRLLEEWELIFAGMRDELGDKATDDAKEMAARSVLRWAEHATIPIRGVIEPFVTRGSLHMLADDGKLGWHPEFREPEFCERLATLLSSSKEQSA
jgi:hypothetical protein